MNVANALQMARQILLPKLKDASVILDATAGNGKDTLFLAQNTPPDAVIWAFDIQQTALASAETHLRQAGFFHKVRFIWDSHVNLSEHIHQPIDAAVYNLGYLPGSDHGITTAPESTVLSLDRLMHQLNQSGLVAIVAYTGHEPGLEEQKAVHAFLQSLPQKDFAVAGWQMLNQMNNPPMLYVIERIRRD
ncbi:class I SAM-dependent methyltransferase [Acetonema longum]|uniref:rRNA methylase n=1 Tax=Acetonema longum DSM 6540 TaxID=1009370 RepID=F7NJZ0_9FIRM|nr:class I SAM-dependent methyltransferase [Acetonema longum]EGO63637.1 hypothetical protein ALO_11999 [Acetonema longum DSM 6540]